MPLRSFMCKPFLVAAMASVLLLASASPLSSHQVDKLPASRPENIQRRQSDFTAVTGITTFGIQPRLEIREMEQNADQWNIYLLGLVRFHQSNQTDKLSYYQIAGIHGRPYIPWDGVTSVPGIDSPGYCHHVSNLFLPWHRPYLSLYEQALYQHIIAAVNEFPAGPVRQRYASAALTWRTPYWDWAAPPPVGQSVLPSSLTNPSVTVTIPSGNVTMNNPLYSYRFHPVSESDFYFNPFGSWNFTMRYPTSWDLNATSQDLLVGDVLDNNRVSFQDRLYNLFTNYNNFTEFSNEAWMNSTTNADSLEAMHDAIHSITGGNGHMTYLDYSAFDPIFWLHHAMIDRCFALWQAIYTDSYVEPLAAVEQTYVTAIGDEQDVNTPLEPFHSDIYGNFWTSASARSTSTFGYTYNDLGNGSVAAVKASINSLYGSSAAYTGVSRRSESSRIAQEREFAAAASNETSVAEEISNGRYHEYMANIQSQKFALNGSYAIYVFMGEFDDAPSTWSLASNLVGTHAVFAALSGVDAASNPQVKRRNAGSPIQVTGTMPLTSMLMAKVQAGELERMDPDTVTPYLLNNLHWRVAMFDNTEIPVADVAGLVVTVVSAEVEPAPSHDAFPGWGDFTELATSTSENGGFC